MVNSIDSRANDLATEMWSKMMANDANGDSQLNKSEIQKFMASMKATKDGGSPYLNEMFTLADTNKDGFITKDEFTNMIRNQKTPTEGASSNVATNTLNKVFSAIDNNGDKKISKEELSDYLLKQLDILNNNQQTENTTYKQDSSTNNTDNPTSSILNLLA